jgi:predicted CXXCH cytochrome family protein
MAVGQVEQMHASRCFIASEGRLGCISCHDPHSVPSSQSKAASYRDRCLRCHEVLPSGQVVRREALAEDGSRPSQNPSPCTTHQPMTVFPVTCPDSKLPTLPIPQ